MNSIHKIIKSKRNIYTAVTAAVLLSVLLFISIFHSIGDIPKNEFVEKSPKSKESDIIITPSGEKTKSFSMENFIYLNSYLNIQYIDNLFRSWSVIFDLFSSNPNLSKSSSVSASALAKNSAFGIVLG